MTQAPARRRLAVAAAVTAVLLATALTACARRQPTFVADAGTLTMPAVEQAAAATDIGSVTDVNVEDAPAVRQEVLARLRRDGPEAAKAATLLTLDFPVKTRSVPVYVAAATVDGKRVWVVVEAWGDRTGLLKHRRLWVFERDTGDLVTSRTWR